VSFGFFSGTSLRTRRLVPIFYGKLRPAGTQTIWLLHFMLQLTTLSYSTQQHKQTKKSNHPTKNTTMVEPVTGL